MARLWLGNCTKSDVQLALMYMQPITANNNDVSWVLHGCFPGGIGRPIRVQSPKGCQKNHPKPTKSYAVTFRHHNKMYSFSIGHGPNRGTRCNEAFHHAVFRHSYVCDILDVVYAFTFLFGGATSPCFAWQIICARCNVHPDFLFPVQSSIAF